ncbi:MAG: hypothetical protein V1835_01575 [Candidatus Micrarchaeota archaeon]
METEIQERAKEDLKAMDAQMADLFIKHLIKISRMPPRRHLKFGLPFNVENVTRQARLVFQIENSKLYILRCFESHKEYERWYNSYK